MLINSASLDALRKGFTSLYNDSYTAATVNWDKVAMLVNSSTGSQKYGWLGQIPRVREWLGDRVVQNLTSFDFEIKNKDFELTIGVPRNDIEDDSLGVYAPLFQMMGDSAAKHPDEIVFPALKNAFTSLCYDGQYFIDVDHPVLDENNVMQSVSNSGGGSGNAWFLMDASKPIKPLIFQKRKDYQFVARDDPRDSNVFDRKEFVYGVDGRDNVGYGLWQLIYGSKQPLDATNYDLARQNITGRKGDGGKPLALTPTLLVCGPSNESKALTLVKTSKNAAGADNIYAGTAEVLVVPYLD